MINLINFINNNKILVANISILLLIIVIMIINNVNIHSKFNNARFQNNKIFTVSIDLNIKNGNYAIITNLLSDTNNYLSLDNISTTNFNKINKNIAYTTLKNIDTNINIMRDQTTPITGKEIFKLDIQFFLYYTENVNDRDNFKKYKKIKITNKGPSISFTQDQQNYEDSINDLFLIDKNLKNYFYGFEISNTNADNNNKIFDNESLILTFSLTEIFSLN